MSVILGDLRIVMGLLLPNAGPAQLLGFGDRTMMYEGDAKALRIR